MSMNSEIINEIASLKIEIDNLGLMNKKKGKEGIAQAILYKDKLSALHKLQCELDGIISESEGHDYIQSSTCERNQELSRSQLLDAAKAIINGDRQECYGDAAKSFESIAAIWTWYTGSYITPVDVCQMMALLKISREKLGAHKVDNFIDQAGYTALGAELSSGSKD